MSNTNHPSNKPLPDENDAVCATCGLTARELRDTGRMGCANCYTVFASMVTRATVELHGSPAAPPPPLADRNVNPWPTRRAETSDPNKRSR